MPLFSAIRSGLRTLFHKDESNQELSEELNAFLEAAAADKMKAGLTHDQALREARLELGTPDSAREQVRSAGWEFRFDTLWQDLRFTGRLLAKTPGFTLMAILTLALGIGANTAIFSVISSALMRPLSARDPQNLALLMWKAKQEPKHSAYSSYGDCEMGHFKGVSGGCSFPKPLLDDIRSHTDVFSGIAASAGAETLDLSGNGPAETIENAEYVSGDYFRTLGVNPLLGRMISTADDTPSASAVVVLSAAYWTSHFGASPSAVGKTVLLNRVPFTVIGVCDRTFDALTPGHSVQIWIPLSVAPRLDLPWDNREVNTNYWWLVPVARLKPSVTRLQAQDALRSLFLNDVMQVPEPMWTKDDNPDLTLVPARAGLTGGTEEIAPPMYVLMVAVGVVLLVACANVAGLLLSRAAVRRKEIALRFALGATRSRVLRQLLTESLLLSLAGGVFGIFFAIWANTAIASFIMRYSDGPLPFHAAMDTRVLLFTAAVSTATGILFGIAPALRSLRVDLTPALKDPSGNTPADSNPRARWFNPGNALAVAQVALTIVVLVVAGLLVRSLQSLRTLDPGFDTRNVLTFVLDPTLIGYKRADIDVFHSQLAGRLRAVPGVTSVTYSWRSLLGGALWTTDFRLPNAPKGEQVNSDVLPIGPDFFQTMGMRLQLGREFTADDFTAAQRVNQALADQRAAVSASLRSGKKPVPNSLDDLAPMPAIVNDLFVKKYFPGRSPLGIRFGKEVADDTGPNANPGWEIIGVASDAKYNSLRRNIEPTMYVPLSGGSVSFSLRTTGAPAAIVPQIRAIVGQMDAALPISRVRTVTEQIDNQLIAERLIARLSSFFGLLALLLACIGLYGLLAFEVTRRTREIGIRIALGADRTSVLRLVVGQGLALAAAGAFIGIAASLGLTRFLSTLLYGVRPTDPVTFIAVAALLGAVAALACYLPARRAMRVDPLVALRYE